MKGILIVAPLMLIIILGMILKSSGFLDDRDRKVFMKLLYWVVLPALLFRSIYSAGGDISDQSHLFFATYSSLIIVPLLTIPVAYLIHKGDRKRIALAAMASARANNVYLGLPAVLLALGEAGAAPVSIYLAVALPGYNLISVVWGELVLSGGLSLVLLRRSLGRIAKNPLILTSITALIFAQLHVKVPATLLSSLNLVGDMATGFALISLGMSLEIKNIRGSFVRAWPDAVVKLILHPTVVWLLFKLWPVPEIMMQTAIIISAMPTAVNTFIIAGGMGMEERYACDIIAVTTVLAAVTIPIWVAMLEIS